MYLDSWFNCCLWKGNVILGDVLKVRFFKVDLEFKGFGNNLYFKFFCWFVFLNRNGIVYWRVIYSYVINKFFFSWYINF